MDNVWEGLFLAIITGALTGSAFFAFKHPKAYDRITTPIFFVLLAGFLFAIFWNFVLSVARNVATSGLDFELSNLIQANIDAKMFSLTYFWVVLGTIAYLVFLTLLPEILTADEEPSD